MENKKIADIVISRFNKMKDICSPIFEAKQLNKALYAQDYYPDGSETEYNLVDPQVFPVIRNYLSRCNPSNTQIRLDPRNEAQFESRQINQQFLNWELSEIALTNLFYKIYYSAFLNGKGYFDNFWLYEPSIVIEEKDEFGEIIRSKVIKEIVNRASSSFVPFDSVLIPDPNITTIREQAYYGRELNLRVGDMLDKNKSLLEKGLKPFWDEKWLKEAKEKGIEKKVLDFQLDFVDNNTDIAKEDLAFRAATVPMRFMQTKEGDVFYIPFGEDKPINNKKEVEYWHGHYSIADFAPFPEDDNYFPMAIVDVFADLAIANSELLNLGLTNLRQSTYNMWISGTPAAQTPDWMFRTRPDGVIRTMGDPNQITQVSPKDVSRQVDTMTQSVTGRIERASGISSLYSSGVASTNINQTARGAQIIDSNIDTNTKMIIDNFGEQVIRVMGEDYLELNAQYVTEEQTIAITNKKGVSDLIRIEPSMVSANFNVSVNSERLVKQTPASRQASIRDTIMVLQNIQNQSQGAVQVDLVPTVEALIDATPEMQEIENVVSSIDEKGERDINMLLRGQMPEIKVRDPHLDLIQLVAIYMENNPLSPEQQALFQQYSERHLQFLQSAQEVQQTVQLSNQVNQLKQNTTQPGLGENEGEQEGISNPTYNLGQIV